MKHVFGIVWKSIKEFWEDLFILVLMNLLTAVLLVPIITFPPALTGLWIVANRAVRGQGVEWSDYFDGFRRYFLKSWGLTLVNIVVFALLYVNFQFYGTGVAPFNLSAEISLWVRMFIVIIGVLWLCLQMYPLAMLLEQEEQRLRLAYRNAAILLFANPGFSLLLAIVILLIAAASTMLPALWAMITLALIALICSNAVQHLLTPHRERLTAAAQEGDAVEDDA